MAKRGRPPKAGKPMTTAERQAAHRKKIKAALTASGDNVTVGGDNVTRGDDDAVAKGKEAKDRS